MPYLPYFHALVSHALLSHHGLLGPQPKVSQHALLALLSWKVSHALLSHGSKPSRHALRAEALAVWARYMLRHMHVPFNALSTCGDTDPITQCPVAIMPSQPFIKMDMVIPADIQ